MPPESARPRGEGRGAGAESRPGQDEVQIVTRVPVDLQPLVNAKRAAELSGIGTRLLWSLTNVGEVRHVRINRRVLYDIRDLAAFIEKRKHGGA